LAWTTWCYEEVVGTIDAGEIRIGSFAWNTLSERNLIAFDAFSADVEVVESETVSRQIHTDFVDKILPTRASDGSNDVDLADI
jgi:hypothetical protein